MGIAGIDAGGFQRREAVRLQAGGELRRRFVAERFAEGEVEGRSRFFLKAVNGMLYARRRIVLLHDQNASRFEPLPDALEKRVPFIDRQFVQDVDERHNVEQTTNAIVITDDAQNAIMFAHLARIGIDGDWMRTALPHEDGEDGVPRTDIQQLRSRRYLLHNA